MTDPSGELRDLLAVLHWSQRSLARILDCDPRQVRRWASGEYSTPPLVLGMAAHPRGLAREVSAAHRSAAQAF